MLRDVAPGQTVTFSIGTKGGTLVESVTVPGIGGASVAPRRKATAAIGMTTSKRGEGAPDPVRKTAAAARLTEPNHMMIAAKGPAGRDHALSFGFAYALSKGLVDLRFVQTISDRLLLDGGLQTGIEVGQTDLGLRFALLDGDVIDVAVRGRLHEEHFLGNWDLVVLGLAPGVLVSFGGDDLQFTLGTDVILYSFAWLEGREGQWEYHGLGVRPFAAVEVDLGVGAALYAELGLFSLNLKHVDGSVEPALSVGLTY